MTFREQRYKNKSRIYYHGESPGSTYKLSCGEFYLTTYFPYAASYAKLNGTVTEYHLSKTCNIFNGLSNQDFQLLKNYCEKYARRFLNVLSRLKKRDWFKLFDQDINKRQELLTIIEDLGFDGYFNFEIDSELDKIHDKNGEVIAPALIHSPSLAVFNPEKCLIQSNIWNGKAEFLENIEMQKAREMQIDYLAYLFLQLCDEGKCTQENVKKLYRNTVGILLFSLEELQELTKSWSFEDIYKDKEKFTKEFAFLKEDSKYLHRPFPTTYKHEAIQLAEHIFGCALPEMYKFND